ncbi:MAG: flavin reductase family protein [Acetobacteraceae bacterium]|nr:flavin reductase family protein [Acetobacteraceae bacterium]
MVTDPRELRRALGRFATGVTIVTTCTEDGRLEGLTANSFTSVSLDPPLVLWSLNRAARSLPSFLSARWFTVNVLGSHQRELSARFAGSMADRFAGLDFAEGLGGCPVLEDGIAHFECSVHDRVDAGDHVIFLGRVERMRHREGVPLLYSSGRYCVPAALELAD